MIDDILKNFRRLSGQNIEKKSRGEKRETQQCCTFQEWEEDWQLLPCALRCWRAALPTSAARSTSRRRRSKKSWCERCGPPHAVCGTARASAPSGARRRTCAACTTLAQGAALPPRRRRPAATWPRRAGSCRHGPAVGWMAVPRQCCGPTRAAPPRMEQWSCALRGCSRCLQPPPSHGRWRRPQRPHGAGTLPSLCAPCARCVPPVWWERPGSSAAGWPGGAAATCRPLRQRMPTRCPVAPLASAIPSNALPDRQAVQSASRTWPIGGASQPRAATITMRAAWHPGSIGKIPAPSAGSGSAIRG